MLKLTMKSNATTCMAPPFDLNPLTKMWRLVTTFQILSFSFPKYVKSAKLAMVQIVGNVEDEKCFSTLAFMKSKLWNRLTTHLPLVVRMFAQCTLQNFPYANVLNNGQLLAIDIVMMARQLPFEFARLVFTKVNIYCCKIEWLFYEPHNFLSMVLTFFTLFSQCNAIGLSFYL